MANFSKSFWEKEVNHQSSLLPLLNQLKGVFFFAKDLESRLIYANQGLIEHYGFGDLENLLATNDYDIHAHHIAVQFIHDDQRVIKSGEPLYDLIELFPDRYGIPQLYLTNKFPLYNKKNQICGVCGTVQSLEASQQRLAPYMSLAPATDYIKAHYCEAIKSEDLAKLVSLSIAQFNRRFKDLFKLTPQRYITRVRILESCNLLMKTNKTVTEIAIECGFYDHSHYTREFKKSMHLSPKQYKLKSIN